MLRFSFALVAAVIAVPAVAQTDKEISCSHQADVVEAIKQARLDGVEQTELSGALATKATWPENYNNIVPILAPSIYEKTPDQLQQEDLSGWWRDQCLKLDQ